MIKVLYLFTTKLLLQWSRSMTRPDKTWITFFILEVISQWRFTPMTKVIIASKAPAVFILFLSQPKILNPDIKLDILKAAVIPHLPACFRHTGNISASQSLQQLQPTFCNPRINFYKATTIGYIMLLQVNKRCPITIFRKKGSTQTVKRCKNKGILFETCGDYLPQPPFQE